MLRFSRSSAAALCAASLLFPGGGAGAHAVPAAARAVVDLSADVVRVDPDSETVEAAGNVRVEIDGTVLFAAAAVFDPASGRLVLSGPFEYAGAEWRVLGDGLEIDLATRTLVVSGPRFTEAGLRVGGSSARCEGGACVIEDAVATPCATSPPACGLEARSVTLHPSGDIDLRGPRLVLGETPVAALPWLRLRPPGSSGLVPPRLGWSPTAGPVVGPAGQVALGEGLLAGGHFAARGISGYESASRFASETGEVRVDHLFDSADGHFGRLRLRLSMPLDGARLSAAGDLVSDTAIIDELTFDPVERALGHTVTHILLTAGGREMTVETHATLLQWFDAPGASRRLLGPATGVRLALPLLTWELPLWPGLILSLDRVESMGEPHSPDATGLHAPAHTRLEARPSLDLSRRLAPFEVRAGASSGHQLWLPDGPDTEATGRHAVAATAGLSLPFEGRILGARHRFAPEVHYRLVAPLAGSAPPWLLDTRDLPAGMQAVDAVLDNSFGAPADPALRVALRQRLHLPGFEHGAGPAWVDARVGGGPRWLHLDLAGALDQRLLRISLLRASLSTADSRGSGLVTGIAWYGPGRGPHLEPGLEVLGAAPDAWPLARPARHLELTEQASAALGRHVLVHAGVRVGVMPAAALHALWYGLRLRAACGCASLGMIASHRPGERVPDVMVSLGLFEQ